MVKILFTFELDGEQLDLATRLGLDFEVLPFIKTVFKYDKLGLVKYIHGQASGAWVFTSNHASMALAQCLDTIIPRKKPEHIFALGKHAAGPFLNQSIPVHIPPNNSVRDLAYLLDSYNKNTLFIHWCGTGGNQPVKEACEELGLYYECRIVYETKQVIPAEPYNDFDIVVFNNAGTVNAYFEHGKNLGQNTQFVCIGQMPVNALKPYLTKFNPPIWQPQRLTVANTIQLIADNLKD